MTVSRDILFFCDEDIESVAGRINASLLQERQLAIRLVVGSDCTWKVADGVLRRYATTLYNVSGVLSDSTDPEEMGLNWNFRIGCRMSRGETSASANARFDNDATTLMRAIGSAFDTRCLLLSNLQIKLDHYP